MEPAGAFSGVEREVAAITRPARHRQPADAPGQCVGRASAA